MNRRSYGLHYDIDSNAKIASFYGDSEVQFLYTSKKEYCSINECCTGSDLQQRNSNRPLLGL